MNKKVIQNVFIYFDSEKQWSISARGGMTGSVGVVDGWAWLRRHGWAVGGWASCSE